MSDVTADPADLLACAERWVAALRERGLAADPAAARLDDVLVRSRGERLDAPEDPLLVAMLCGPTAVGKSSLINAIAGEPISNPGLGATTSHALVYVHERDDPSRLFEYGEALGQLGRDGASLVRHARDELLHKVLVDTPDIDSALSQHGAVTEALVHCADLVFFVTSPEKYKTMHSARWVAGQRRQRAIAFVLNKWDRAAFGLQYDRRDLVERDFQQVLATEGFADPLVFKVSTLEGPEGAATDLRALQSWLAEGLDGSLSTAIQERRRRSAWGRLGSAIAPVVPAPLSNHPFILAAKDALTEAGKESRRTIDPEVLSLSPRGLGRDIRPATPGLFGSWMNLVDGLATAAPVRLFTALRGSLDGPITGARSAASGTFGRPAADLLASTARDLSAGAETRRLSLGPVGATWSAEAEQLRRQLGLLPSDVETELMVDSVRPSLRRSAGLAVFWGTEILVTLVLLLALWRIGSGFAAEQYAKGNLILNTVALVLILLLCGQAAVKLTFPALGLRLRTTVGGRARVLIDAAWRRAQATLDEQVQAAARLADEGRDLLSRIDAVVRSLGDVAQSDGAARLFGEMPAARAAEPVLVAEAGRESARPSPARRPRFD